ncbi:Helicase associated domain protein [Paracoccaceae bacterium]|nr:Helicase associated domain protein [Paracoccaceae bacterium]
MVTFDRLIESIRAEFGEQNAGKKFAAFCKWFLENDPEWSKIVDKVWLWEDYPNKWIRLGLGPNLIFRDKDGLIWAVQAKYYAKYHGATKGDTSSFLSDIDRNQVKKCLWLQTTNKMEANAKKSLEGHHKHVTIFSLNDFRSAKIDYPNSYSQIQKGKTQIKPKPDIHQIEAIEAVCSKLSLVDRGQMIMACGTGKTFTTLWIKEALNAHTTLVLVPSLSLLSQTMRQWALAGNTDFEILNVCSDKSVGKNKEDMKATDALFPVTTSVTEITNFLKKSEPKVVFCTYQSSSLIVLSQLDSGVPNFDLTVADEAHRCAGKVDAEFATVLDSEKIRSNKRLFTTATPRVFGKAIKDESKANDLAVVGMDDEKLFGEVLHKLSFGEAIQRELLNDYQVVIVGVDEPMVRQWIDNNRIVFAEGEKTLDARALAEKIGLIKAIRDYDLKRVISFHSRVERAKKFSEELVDYSSLIDSSKSSTDMFFSDYVSGSMVSDERRSKIETLQLLEGYDRGLLTNARCLAEGIDVPSLDGIAFIDPKGSQIEIIQAVGRVIRKVRGKKNKTKGTIVIPVFIEDGDDPRQSIEASKFKPIWEVLKALRAHDELLANNLDQCRAKIAKDGLCNQENIEGDIHFDIPNSIDVNFSDVLRTVLVEKTTVSWGFWFGLLQIFVKREGHGRVPALHEEGDYRLGRWSQTQRALKSIMSSDRREKLNALGFVWDPRSEDWEEGFRKLQQFQKREGHCHVKKSHMEDGFPLGEWAKKRRHFQDRLTPDHKKRLDAIGFFPSQPQSFPQSEFTVQMEFLFAKDNSSGEA